MSGGDVGAFVWQGFDHEWLRTALGFRLPHRISKLDSYIADEHHGGEAPWSASARFHFGQATGVDGNYMRPTGYYAAIASPRLRAFRRTLRLEWTDEIEGDLVPHAESRASGEVVVAADEIDHDAAIGGLLRGFSLTTRCDPAKQPPELPRNSDGMWPYVFRIGVGEHRLEAGELRIPVQVEIHRGWTPMKGGVPGIEEKPLNRRLDFDLAVHVTVLTGPPDTLAIHRGEPVIATGRARDVGGRISRTTIVGDGMGRYRHHAIGVTSFGFELPARSEKPRHQHRGRYIGGLRFRARPAGYDADTGLAAVDHAMRVWVPRTVVPTDVRYEMQSALVQLGADATAVAPRVAGTSLCSNSAAEAPFFSRWNRCGSDLTGPERDVDSVAIVAP